MIKRYEGKQQMKPHMIRFSDGTWAAAKAKAGITPLSAIIRKLVRLWLAGEIEIK
jgi:transcription-repair coupling factor (superfamily II helicase)